MDMSLIGRTFRCDGHVGRMDTQTILVICRSKVIQFFWEEIFGDKLSLFNL
jgi:hypothetical protein